MFIEVLTPDQKVYEGEVVSASFPGIEGSFQILDNHAPLISPLGRGDMKFIKETNKKQEEIHMLVDGGVVEVRFNKVTVLAENILDE